MQQAEIKVPSATPCLPEDNDQAILERVLPSLTEDGLQLGVLDRPTVFRFALAIGGVCTVHQDAEGRFLGQRWRPSESGAAGAGFEQWFAGMSGPILLLLRRDHPVLVMDRATILVGLDGIAIKQAAGQFEFIRAEEILGVSHRTSKQPEPPQSV